MVRNQFRSTSSTQLFFLIIFVFVMTACGEPPPMTSADGGRGASTTSSTTTGSTQTAKPAIDPARLRALAALPTVTPRPEVVLTPDQLAAARAKLPPSAPEDAEIVTDIKPSKRNGRLVYAVASEPQSFNPIVSTSIGDQEAQNLMFAGLTGYDQYHQKPTPGLAKSWEYDPASLTWTFHLRKGLKWSDGQPLTANDFLFFTEIIFDPAINNDVHPYLRQDMKQADSPPYQFSSPDPYTLKVKLPIADSFSELNLGLVRPLPRHKLEQLYREGKINQTWLQNVDPAELVVSGPFKLKEFRRGEAMYFEPNPNFYRYDTEGNQLPLLNSLVVKILPDSQSIQNAFMAGDLDLLEGIDPQLLPLVMEGAKTKDYIVYPLGPSLNSNHYWFNTNRGGTYTGTDGKLAVWQPKTMGETPPADLPNFKPYVSNQKLHWFSNPEFRRACSEATNRQQMIDTVLNGLGAPLYGLIAPANREWYNADEPKFPYNPDSAKERLDKLGWVDRDKDGWREDEQGRTIRFSIVSARESRIRERIVQMIAKDLQAVGLNVNSQVVQFNSLITQVSETFDYDAVLLGLGTGVPPHPAMAGNTWRSSGDNHLGYPKQLTPQTEWEARLDVLYESMKRTFSVPEQQKILFEMQNVLNENQSAVFLFSSLAFVAAKNQIVNLKPTIIRSSVTHNPDELTIQ